MTSSSDITALLVGWSSGDQEAFEVLYPLVEQELRRIAKRSINRIQPGQTLQTTDLINEAYLRLIDQDRVRWQNRAHFFAIAAGMMRRVLLNHIRDRNRDKRGGGAVHVSLSESARISDEKATELIALDEALHRLAKLDQRKSQVIELRFFGGLTVEETAEVLHISDATVMRDWQFARAWLKHEITNE